MNPSMFLHKVRRVYTNETRKYHEKDGRTYHCRDIVIHDAAGETFTIGLMADAPGNTADCLDMLPREPTEAGLKRLTTEELDALANAVRAERQSRTPEPAPDAQDYPTLAEYEAALHPRDCPGVTVTEDDGEGPF